MKPLILWAQTDFDTRKVHDCATERPPNDLENTIERTKVHDVHDLKRRRYMIHQKTLVRLVRPHRSQSNGMVAIGARQGVEEEKTFLQGDDGSFVLL